MNTRPPHPDDARAQLAAYAARRHAAEIKLQEIHDELGPLVVSCRGVLSLSEIARVSGLSRKTIYRSIGLPA
jgi:DNA-binding phage protein